MVNMARSNPLSPSPTTHPDEYTRTRLLNRLGLFQHPPAVAAARRRYPSTAFSSQEVDFSKTTLHPSLVRNGGQRPTPALKPAIVQTDNDNAEDDDNKDDTENSNHLGNNHDKKKEDHDRNDVDSSKVKFSETIDVVSIPSRHHFSNRIKNVYWSNRYELQENAERNILEYEYEGWDYHNVVLDDEMYVDVTTGALIHPCHLSVDEATGQTMYNTYAAEEEELKDAANEQGCQRKLKEPQQQVEGDGEEEDDGFEYEYDDSYFRPLQRKSSVASSQ
jgi:hypothetical protein